jgi:hypothetical protein
MLMLSKMKLWFFKKSIVGVDGIEIWDNKKNIN